jgi:hypothetical protein
MKNSTISNGDPKATLGKIAISWKQTLLYFDGVFFTIQKFNETNRYQDQISDSLGRHLSNPDEKSIELKQISHVNFIGRRRMNQQSLKNALD